MTFFPSFPPWAYDCKVCGQFSDDGDVKNEICFDCEDTEEASRIYEEAKRRRAEKESMKATKIIIHYEDGSKETVQEKGLVAVVKDNDLDMTFCNMDVEDIIPVVKAMKHAFEVAVAEAERMKRG